MKKTQKDGWMNWTKGTGMFGYAEMSSSQQQYLRQIFQTRWPEVKHPLSCVGDDMSDLSYKGIRQPLLSVESLIKNQAIHFSAYVYI